MGNFTGCVTLVSIAIFGDMCGITVLLSGIVFPISPHRFDVDYGNDGILPKGFLFPGCRFHGFPLRKERYKPAFRF